MPIRVFKHTYILASLILGTALCACATNTSQTLAETQKNERQFSAKTGELVNSALQALNMDNYPLALVHLDKALLHPDLNPYEKSIIFQMKGQAFYEMKQTKKAIQAFEDAFDASGLLDKEASQLRLNIGQLWISEGEYVRGAEMIEAWGRNGNTIRPNHVELLVQAWVSSDNYARALPWAERWYNDANPKERKHYDLMNFLYNNLGLPDKQVNIAKDMIQRWPEDKILRDALASLYINSRQDRRAFEVHRESYRLGLLENEHDIIQITRYHVYYGMPDEALKILEKEMEDGHVFKSLDNLIWLSVLQQRTGDDEAAKASFAQAADIGGEAAATRKKASLKNDFGTQPTVQYSGAIPDFKAPKINRSREFKIQVSDRDAQPLVRIPPVMPANAEKSGHCKLRFDVDIDGNPENIVTTFCTQRLFENASIESVAKWKYNPKYVKGRAIGRSGVETKVKFWFLDEKGNIVPE